MKKQVCVVLALFTLLSCLTACSFTQSMTSDLTSESESAERVEEMMTALAENRVSDVKNLMHPKVAEVSDTAIDQMSSYLAGREASSMERVSINVNTSVGTAGKTREEEVVYQVPLADGTVIYLMATYLSDNDGTGFFAFQLVLGVI